MYLFFSFFTLNLSNQKSIVHFWSSGCVKFHLPCADAGTVGVQLSQRDTEESSIKFKRGVKERNLPWSIVERSRVCLDEVMLYGHMLWTSRRSAPVLITTIAVSSSVFIGAHSHLWFLWVYFWVQVVFTLFQCRHVLKFMSSARFYLMGPKRDSDRKAVFWALNSWLVKFSTTVSGEEQYAWKWASFPPHWFIKLEMDGAR